ncbi:hypothetical protein D9M69_357230 [compost metagenome]
MLSTGCPLLSLTAWITPANAPSVPDLSMAITGMMVRKMPANSLPTSRIGSQLNSLPARAVCGVTSSDTTATTISSASRSAACSGTSVPKTLNEIAGCHSPLISTRPIRASSSTKLILPSIVMPFESGVGSFFCGSSSSLLR